MSLSNAKKQYKCEQYGINFDSLEGFSRHDKEKLFRIDFSPKLL